MKLLPLLITALLMTGCSTGGGLQRSQSVEPKEVASVPQTESAFQESSGTLNLVFDAKGNWVKISAKGSAGLTEDSPTARETALMIASMRAKRTVAEFLNNDVKSSKTFDRIARSFSRNFQSMDKAPAASQDDSEASMGEDAAEKVSAQTQQANRFASKLVERIQDSSSAIIKGSFVSFRAFEDGRVIVELTATRDSIGAARQVSRMMSGGLQ